MGESVESWQTRWTAEAQDRVIMFVGMAESSKYKETHGLETGLLRIRDHAEVVWSVVQARCTCKRPADHVVKHVGDEVMLSFPQDELPTALRCAIDTIDELDKLDIQTKIGIAYGKALPCLLPQPPALACDPQGPPVDIAAQLDRLAQPRQILVDAHYQQAVRNFNFTTRAGDPVIFVPQPASSKKLRGIADGVKVSAACWGGHSGIIRNNDRLGLDLKRIDHALTMLLMQREGIRTVTQEEFEAAAPATVQLLRDRMRGLASDGAGPIRLPGALHHLHAVYDSCEEAKDERFIQDGYDALAQSFESARSLLEGARKRLEKSDQQQDRIKVMTECHEALTRIFVAARQLQEKVQLCMRRYHFV